MKTATMKTKAWISSIWLATPQDLAKGDISGLSFCQQDMTTIGWTYAGEAEVTVQLVDDKTLVENKVEALRAEAKEIRAEASARCTKIEGLIQNLLAISYDTETVCAGSSE